MFKLHSEYKPTGDQPQAIEYLSKGIKEGKKFQTLLGVTGSGKTFTMANIIEKTQKPTLVLAHNKTLAGQLYSEFKEFFPENAVEYFVSYYDYYQPEAYIPQSDTYIEKDASINDEIDKLRHSATLSLFETRDVIIIASVSCIYGLGDPVDYNEMMLSLRPQMTKSRNNIMKKLFLLLATAAATTGMLQAQNPVIRNQFSADPTARVFNGKVYIYPSHDIPSPVKHLKEWFCMADYHVFTSTNLTHWTDLGVILSQNEIPWVQPDSYSMWAPECVYKNEKYYFYFPSTPKGEGRRGFNIGVATADNPEGPFTPEAEPIKGISGIDPCVLVDTDGEAYIYWSGRGMSVAKLKPNMKELASEPIQVQGLPEGFKEGPYVFKRNGKYYFTFPWVQDKTENLAYAMGDSPMGPFTFKGIIMDESPVGCWTNHHSITEYNGQWYLFYHHNDYSPNFDKNRSVRIDSLFFNTDGTIKKVKPTLRGVGMTDARSKIQLDRYSAISPYGVSIDYLDPTDTFQGWQILFHRTDTWAVYNNVDFGTAPVKRLKARVRSEKGGTITLQTIGDKGVTIAVLSVKPTGQWAEISTSVRNAPKGVQSLKTILTGEHPVAVDWISFE